MTKAEEFIFRQVVASSRLESRVLTSYRVEILRLNIEEEITLDKALELIIKDSLVKL